MPHPDWKQVERPEPRGEMVRATPPIIREVLSPYIYRRMLVAVLGDNFEPGLSLSLSGTPIDNYLVGNLPAPGLNEPQTLFFFIPADQLSEDFKLTITNPAGAKASWP